MSGHLSAEEMAKWMAGERSVDTERHVRQCAQCSGELAGLEETLTHFRGAVRCWSDRLAPPARLREARGPMLPAKWALAAAALAMLSAIPVYRSAAERRREAERERADAALLEQVDAAVSRRVPSPMEPLMSLVAWGPEPTEGTRTK
jgi:hypothetical protein